MARPSTSYTLFNLCITMYIVLVKVNSLWATSQWLSERVFKEIVVWKRLKPFLKKHFYLNSLNILKTGDSSFYIVICCVSPNNQMVDVRPRSIPGSGELIIVYCESRELTAVGQHDHQRIKAPNKVNTYMSSMRSVSYLGCRYIYAYIQWVGRVDHVRNIMLLVSSIQVRSHKSVRIGISIHSFIHYIACSNIQPHCSVSSVSKGQII